jgi:predicted amidohydrolase
MNVRVAAVQMEVVRSKEDNLKRAATRIEEAASRGARFVCLPEYFLTDCPEAGMTAADLEEIAEPIPGPTTKRLGMLAQGHGIYLVAGSIIERRKGEYYNTSALIDPSGKVIGTYSKTHPENAEAKYEVGSNISPGGEYPVFDTKLGKIGILIDMDMATAEAPRILGIKGAEIVFWPINWSARWYRAIEIYAAAHAGLNKYYVVSSNRVGRRKSRLGEFLYNGGSRIVNPEGFFIGGGQDFQECVVIGDVDLDYVTEWRKKIIPRDYPYRRRPETYRELTET